MIKNELRDLIIADPELAYRLGLYTFTTGSSDPAVFTYSPAPEDATDTIITMIDIGEKEKYDTLGHAGGINEIELYLWGSKSRSNLDLDNLAKDLFLKIHRNNDITKTGYTIAKVSCEWPEEIRDADGFPGYKFIIEYHYWVD